MADRNAINDSSGSQIPSTEGEDFQRRQQKIKDSLVAILERNRNLTSMVNDLARRDKEQVERITRLEADCDELREAVIVRETCGSWERVLLRRLRNIAREAQGVNFDQAKFASGCSDMGFEYSGGVGQDIFLYRHGLETDESLFIEEYGVSVADARKIRKLFVHSPLLICLIHVRYSLEEFLANCSGLCQSITSAPTPSESLATLER